VVALSVGAGAVLLASGGESPPPAPSASASSPLPSLSSQATGEPSSSVTPGSPTLDALPKAAALPASKFVVPLGGRDNNRLFVRSARGSNALKLRTPVGHHVNSPALSADRRSLIYIDRTGDALRTIAVDGSGDRLLLAKLKGCASITHITWNPVDQTQLVVRCLGARDANRLFVCTLDGEIVRDLDPPHARFDDPALSPDGVSVAYWASDRGPGRGGASIYVVPIDGSAAERRLTRPGSQSDIDPAWSPDGSRIAFTRRINAKNSNIYSVTAAGKARRPLMTGPGAEQKPVWSPDGSELLIVSNRDAAGRPGRLLRLYLVKVANGAARRLNIAAPDLSTPVWSRR